MSDLIEVVKAWLESHEWDEGDLKFSEDGSEASFRFSCSGDGESYEAFLDIDIGKEWVQMFHYLPGKVPEKRRRLVAELLTRLNPHVKLGNIELIMGNGSVRYRTGLDFEGGTLGVKMLENMSGGACLYLDRYYEAIMAVAFAGHSPERALATLDGAEQIDKPKDEWLAAPDEIPGWEQFPATDCLKGWAVEIKAALAGEEDPEAWAMIGHGAILAVDNLQRGEAMLRRVAADAGLKFAVLSADSVADLPLGIADPFRSLAPALVCLEGGVWMQSPEEGSEADDDDRKHHKFRENLIEKLKAFDPHRPVLYAITAYKVNDVASHLRAVGVFDRRFEVPTPPLEFVGNEFINSIGRDLCAESLTGSSGKVGKLVSGHDSERARDLSAQAMRRLARREGRKVEFVDLVNFSCKGIQMRGLYSRCAEHRIEGVFSCSSSDHGVVAGRVGSAIKEFADALCKRTPVLNDPVDHGDPFQDAAIP